MTAIIIQEVKQKTKNESEFIVSGLSIKHGQCSCIKTMQQLITENVTLGHFVFHFLLFSYQEQN